MWASSCSRTSASRRRRMRESASTRRTSSPAATSCASLHNPPMPLTGKRLAFIGGGTMAEAMMRGVFEKHLVPPSHVLVTGPRRERRVELAKAYGVKALASNAEAAHDAHVVVLSVKPQVLPTVLRELHGKLGEEQLVISIVAGAPLAVLRDGLAHAAIV